MQEEAQEDLHPSLVSQLLTTGRGESVMEMSSCHSSSGIGVVSVVGMAIPLPPK